jgi:hypothetical protein
VARLALVGLTLAAAACRAQAPEARSDPAAQEKPPLALLTALPIVFGEGFSLDSPAHPVLTALSARYGVRPIDGPEQLPEGGLLLAAQPRALTSQRLVALDAWVRRGGRVLLLADPRLNWPSERPLGDMFRPPYSFDDTGLLEHWGLRLSFSEAPGEMRKLGGRSISGTSPGMLQTRTGDCTISDAGLRADCRLGRGRAVVIADADWLDPRQWLESTAGPVQMAALTEQLKLLDR